MSLSRGVLFVIFAVALTACSYDGGPADSTEPVSEALGASAGENGGVGIDKPGADAVSQGAEFDRPADEPNILDAPASPADEEPVPDVEYATLICDLPDPLGLGAGILFGGGANEGTVAVYVYDDADCSPIPNAKVVIGASAAVYTDENGSVEIATAPGAVLTSTHATGFNPWSYLVDARVLYFRLQAYDREFSAADSPEGRFHFGGAPLDLDNPEDLDGFFEQPAYGGVVLPGLSRSTIYSTIYKPLFADETFNVNWIYDDEVSDDPIPFPRNLYLPDVNAVLDIPDLLNWGFWGGNELYRTPVWSGIETGALNGFVFSLEVSATLNPEALLSVITAIAEGHDDEEVLLALVKPLIDRGFHFPYVAMNPEWITSTAPDLDVVAVDPEESTIPVRVENADPAYDYLFILFAEVPGRSIVPLDVAAATDGSAQLTIADVANADYLVAAFKTDALLGHFETQTLAVNVRYAEDPRDWAEGMAFVDSDFSAAFDEAGTRYDHGSGRFQWAVNDESMDVILLASTGYWGTDPDLHYALVPMESGALTFPLTQLGFHYNNVDSLTAIAVDLPDGVAEGFDPTRLFGYDNTRYAVWSSWPVFESLLEALLEATEL